MLTRVIHMPRRKKVVSVTFEPRLLQKINLAAAHAKLSRSSWLSKYLEKFLEENPETNAKAENSENPGLEKTKKEEELPMRFG